jgi:heme oxygenase
MSLAVVAPLEPIVATHVPLYRSNGRSRREAIVSDLRTLGASDESTGIHVPAIFGEAEAYGAAYVLQGSMLGGALIRRAILRDLGPDAPTTYLNFHGDALGAVWKAFVADLDRFGDRGDTATRHRAVASARATFAAFAAALTELTCPNPLT